MGSDSLMNNYPDGWVKTRLADICSPRKAIVDPATVEEIPYVGLEHLDSGAVAIRRWGSSTEVKSSKTEFKAGDVLYGKLRPYLDKAVIAPWRGVCSTELIAFQVDENRTVADYLVCLVHSRPFIQYAIERTAGTNLPRTSWNALKDFSFPLPPLAEQRAIAHVLRTVQQAKEATEKVIDAARQLKKSLMQHLFTYGPVAFGEADRTELTDTDVGQIPSNWQSTNIEALKSPQRGSIVSGPFGSNIGKRFFVPSGVPLIRGCNLTTGSALFVEEGFVFITEEKARELQTCTAMPDDLIFTAAGTIGQVGLIPSDCRYPKYVISNKQLRARVDQTKVRPLFLFYWFSQPRMQKLIRERKSGTSIPVINLSVLRSLPVGLPELTVQQEIASHLSALDKYASTQVARANTLGQLFFSLLHSLMTGQIRVHDLDLPELKESS